MGNRRKSLDGLRALAILAVLGFHYEQPHVSGGLLGVQAFFVLSGWLITSILVREHSRTRRIDKRAFYVRRVLRLMPALVVVTVAVLVVALAAGPSHGIGWAAAGSVTYFNDFLIPLGHDSAYLSPTWSLAVEFQFYLVWPFVLAMLLARGRVELVGRWLLIAALVMFVGEAVAGAMLSLPWVYFTPIGSIAALLAGSGLALSRLTVHRAAGLAGVVVLIAVCFLAPDWTHQAFWLGWVQLAAVASVATVAWLAADDRAPVFSSRAAVWIGERSYGIYLIHTAVRVALLSILVVSASTITVLGITLSVALAAIMYRFVEMPFLALKERRRGEVVYDDSTLFQSKSASPV